MPAGAIGTVWAAGSWANDCWEIGTWADAIASALAFVPDMNTRIRVYLCDLYSAPETSDITPLIQRYLSSQSGEMTARFQKLIRDATDAMS